MKKAALLVLMFAASMSAQSSWGPWGWFANNVQISYARVNATTLTWQFKNTSSNCRVEPFNFNYTYVDANTGLVTQGSDIQPMRLAPGQGVGGWSAFTANTRGPLLSIAPSQTVTCD